MIRPIWSAKAALPTTLPCTVTLTVMLGPPAIRRETSWGMILVPLGRSTISPPLSLIRVRPPEK